MKELSREEFLTLQLDILCHFHELCAKEGITYCLAYGSLLGAVRHNGFIPWDDDIDLFVPRGDFEKLCLLHEENSHYHFGNPTEENYHLSFGKYMRTDTKMTMDTHVFDHYPLGVHIDIFPCDAVSAEIHTPSVRRKFKRIALFSQFSSYAWIPEDSLLKNIIKSILRLSSLFYPPKKRIQKAVALLQKIHGDDCLYAYNEYGPSLIRKDLFQHLILHEFAGHQFYIPACYDDVLRAEYGDYMTPPKNTESSHKFKAYRRQ